MFTGNTITLGELARTLTLDVRRDAAISYVGKVPTPLARRLVYGSKPAHLAGLGDIEGIAAAIVPPELASEVPAGLGLVISPAPAITAAEILEYLKGLPDFLWQSFETRVAPSAKIAPSAVIAPRDVVIGDDTIIDANVVVRERSIVGRNCYLAPQVTVGVEAFDFHPGRPRRLLPQVGGVRLGDHVTLSAGTMISRSAFGGFTELGDEVMVDNLVYIAHDCIIGRRVTITSGTQINGRVTIGDDCYLGPNSTVSNGITIGKSAYITLGSVVVRDVEEGSRVTGNFAVAHGTWIKFVKSLVGRE